MVFFFSFLFEKSGQIDYSKKNKRLAVKTPFEKYDFRRFSFKLCRESIQKEKTSESSLIPTPGKLKQRRLFVIQRWWSVNPAGDVTLWARFTSPFLPSFDFSRLAFSLGPQIKLVPIRFEFEGKIYIRRSFTCFWIQLYKVL